MKKLSDTPQEIQKPQGGIASGMTRPYLRLVVTLAMWRTADKIKGFFPRSKVPEKLEELISTLTVPLHHAGQATSHADKTIRSSKRFTQLEQKIGPDLLAHELVDAIREVFVDLEDDDEAADD
jgi:hypothetical protein